MICGLVSYPLTCDPKDILKNQHRMESVMYYSGDVMVRGAYPAYSKRIWDELGITVDITDEDKKELKEGKVDIYTFSYYSTSCVTTHEGADMGSGNFSMGAKNPYVKYSDWDWAMDPDGLRYILSELYTRYQVPIIVTENGLGQDDVVEADGSIHDDYRIEHLRETIKEIEIGIEECADIMGYCPWSAVDLVSTREGITKRYGFIYVDRDEDDEKAKTAEMKRYRKDSFYWYKKVIASNGEDLD